MFFVREKQTCVTLQAPPPSLEITILHRYTKEYMHKDIPDGTEICMLKHPLTAEEWNQILQNQEIVSRLPELLRTFLTDIATGMELDDDEIKNMINSTVKAWMGK